MERAHLKRRLTAVLIADVVGYSRLMDADEEGTHLRLAEHVKTLVEPKIAEHGGRMIRTAGDGFLVEFDSAVDAVHCGLEIHRELAERNAAWAPNRRMQFRIGVNTGDVIVDGHDIYGNSINIAAHLEGLAEPGGVYVTRSVREQLQGLPSLVFEDRGERRVKNIKTPIRVYRVTYCPDHKPRFVYRAVAIAQRFSSSRPSARTTLLSTAVLATLVTLGLAGVPTWRDWRAAPRASIMVLPFLNLSGDRAEDYFADAVTDDVTTDLSRVPGAFVISSATAFSYKGKAVSERQIGEECGVRYLLEGSIRRSGTRVQTNARLVDAVSAVQLWADRFDNELTDLFELEEAITGRISASLDAQLVQAEYRRVLAQPAASADAVDLRLRAIGLYITGISPEHTLAARGLLRDSVRLDPQSAQSWAWLADLLASDYLNRWNNAGRDELAEAQQAAERAVAIDPYMYLAHFARGFIYRARGENTAALDAFAQALKLNRNFARGYAQEANELINVGRPAEAPRLVEKAMALSPRDPGLGVFYWILGRAHFFSKHYPEAIVWLRKSVDARPNLWFNRLYLVSAYTLLHDESAARAALHEFYGRFSGYSLAQVISHEQDIPASPFIRVGLEDFHAGLRVAGMPEH